MFETFEILTLDSRTARRSSTLRFLPILSLTNESLRILRYLPGFKISGLSSFHEFNANMWSCTDCRSETGSAKLWLYLRFFFFISQYSLLDFFLSVSLFEHFEVIHPSQSGCEEAGGVVLIPDDFSLCTLSLSALLWMNGGAWSARQTPQKMTYLKTI